MPMAWFSLIRRVESLCKKSLRASSITDVTHRLNNVLYSQDVAPRMGFVIPLTLQIMVVD